VDLGDVLRVVRCSKSKSGVKKSVLWKYMKAKGLASFGPQISESKGFAGKNLKTKDLSFVFCSPY